MDCWSTFKCYLGNRVIDCPLSPVQFEEMEKNFRGVSRKRISTVRNRLPWEVDQLFGPFRQEKSMGRILTSSTLRLALTGWNSLVFDTEINQQVQNKQFRTQNKIKNRFYGTIRNIIRFVLSYFDSTRTCYNWEISKLSPKFLNDLYGSQNSNSWFMQPSLSWMVKQKKQSTRWNSLLTKKSWLKESENIVLYILECIR